jgi:hypothetical protein
MKTGLSKRIREALRAEPDGLTSKDTAARIGSTADAVTIGCRLMPDTYIDRWVFLEGSRGQPCAVWCVVVPPPDCPKPTRHLSSRIRVRT